MKKFVGFLLSVVLIAGTTSNSWALVSVPFRILRQSFNEGDSIVIDEVQVTSLPLRRFSEVHVSGHYTLVSAPSAFLGINVGISPHSQQGDRVQPIAVDHKTGAFDLRCNMPSQGTIQVLFSGINGTGVAPYEPGTGKKFGFVLIVPGKA